MAAVAPGTTANLSRHRCPRGQRVEPPGGGGAWLSRRAQGVPDGDLFMAVLLQQVIPARYAFVLHTADPLTREAGRLHGEVVVGMGEALVGNFPGRALAFTAAAAGGGDVDVLGLPFLIF